MTTREDIDYGQVTESLNDKLDRDLSNSIVPMDFIVATKAPTLEDPSWFRMYKSGWVEQGGICNISQDTATIITLSKEMKNTNYSIIITARKDGATQTGGDGNFTADPISTTQFYWRNGDDFSGKGYWVVKGFAKDSMSDEETGETVYGNTYKIYKGVYPDYNNGITIQSTATSGSYTAPNDGEIQVYMIPGSGTSTFKINGVDMGAQKKSTSGSYAVFNQAHVQKGDSITWTTSVSSQIQAYFYPFKDIDAEMNLADDSEVVHLEGNETIDGTKTFTISPTVGTLALSNNSTSAASTEFVINVLKAIYPVGSLYIGTQTTCPMSTFFGTWTLVSSGKALWTGNGSNANTTIDAGLPNISDNFYFADTYYGTNFILDSDKGLIKYTNKKVSVAERPRPDNDGKTTSKQKFTFDASKSNSIYGKSSTVQPPAYVVNVWRRTA